MRIKEIILDKKESTVYCESFVYEPSNVEEERFGHLFMVGRIRNVPENYFYLINLLASRIKREYYNLRYRSPYQAFEAAMKEGNKVLKENEERINWLGNLDFLVAIVEEKKIYFTLIGKIKSFILRENEIIDLVRDLILEKDALFPFSTILQSNIKKDDILIFSTSNIFSKEILINEGKNIFPIEEEKIAKIITTDDSGVALIVETGKTAEVVERLKPSIKVSPPPMVLPKINLPQKERLKESAERGKDFFKNIANKSKRLFGPKVKKIESSIQAKKEEIAPRITVEKMHYSQKFKKSIRKIFRKKGVAVLIVGLLVLGIIFGIGLYKKSVQLKTVQKTIETVKAKQNESENYLVYGDKEKAISVLSETLDNLNAIKNPGAKKQEIENLKKEIEAKIAEITGRKILTDIIPLFEIKKTDKTKTGTEAWQGNGILLGDKDIYVFSTDSSFVYQWNTDKKSGEFLKKRAKILGGAIVNKKISFFLSPASLVISGKEKTLPIEFPYENASVNQINGYLNFLYILDSKEGELIKYKVSESVVEKPSLWLKERNKVKEASSFAIDGSIYFLFSNGRVQKFSRGNLIEEISPPKTYPQIKSAAKIFTSADNKYLYITDPQEKRVIVLDKKGNVVAEYQSDQFENMKDIWASVNDKIIYLLCNDKVFTIEM